VQPFTPLPVPSWSLGQPVPLAALKASTDRLFAQLEPRRKLAAPDVASPAISGALAAMAQALGTDAGPALAESVRKALASKVVVTEGGKPVAGRFMGAAEAETKIGARRAEVGCFWGVCGMGLGGRGGRKEEERFGVAGATTGAAVFSLSLLVFFSQPSTKTRAKQHPIPTPPTHSCTPALSRCGPSASWLCRSRR